MLRFSWWLERRRGRRNDLCAATLRSALHSYPCMVNGNMTRSGELSRQHQNSTAPIFCSKVS
eukprot:768405-Hanusia_phi.AAC.8